jgi:hypothetical protein
MPTMTVQALIDLASKDLGVEASGESLQPEDYTDALAKFNNLLDSWDAERLSIYAFNRTQYNLSNGVGSYTLGSGGSLAGSTRPISIRAANIIDNSHSSPMDIISVEEYNAIPTKTDTSITPKKLYSDNDFPLTTIYVQPLPNGTPVLELYTWEPMPQFSTIATTFTLPPAYMRALEFNLALDMASMFGRTVDPVTLAGIAAQAKKAMQDLSLPPSPGQAQEAASRAEVQSLATPR